MREGVDMADLNQKVVEQWERLRVLMASAEDDLLKNARGNVSAGVRLRKTLRLLKKETSDLVKLTVLEDKSKKSRSASE